MVYGADGREVEGGLERKSLTRKKEKSANTNASGINLLSRSAKKLLVSFIIRDPLVFWE